MMSHRFVSILLITLSFTVAAYPPTVNITGDGWKSYCEGNCTSPRKRNGKTYGGSIYMGGGLDVTASFLQQITWSGGGDFVILRADDDNGYNDWIYTTLGGVNSVTSLIVFNKSGTGNDTVLNILNNADAIFLGGGDQWQYVSVWGGTMVQMALRSARGIIPVGGTSAGCMVLSHEVFNAENGGCTSAEALANPYSKYINIGPGFINMTNIPYNVIFDTHFVTRNRFGRLLTWVARYLQDGGFQQFYGVGYDEQSSLVTSSDGQLASLVGFGSAFVIYGDVAPTVCAPGMPLSIAPLSVQKLEPGDTFDFTKMEGGRPENRYKVGAVNGKLTTHNPYSP